MLTLLVTLGSPKYAKLRERFWSILGHFGAGHQLLKSSALVDMGQEMSGSGSSVMVTCHKKAGWVKHGTSPSKGELHATDWGGLSWLCHPEITSSVLWLWTPGSTAGLCISWGSQPQHSTLHRSSCRSPRNLGGLAGLISCLPQLSPC